ncbi:aminotransferase class IV [Paraglaciecola aquimarina]|uniref:branched-chain-amino-acid transaminase n=1 Tax=Paraglaciecola algarum TaxID=3050085 RepID=A0ABS9D1S7_9ALTE|nr:aminotransferase class IV [Paraglaciecola sp. G1-23]MCF2946861.1 aminotransferase class IV [Paraglaciecola sp. G1-23]
MRANSDIVFLNGDYLPMNEAKISPMDRGFLFGDGIYEMVPSYGGQLVGLGLHIKRMQNGLKAIGIQLDMGLSEWRDIALNLTKKNGSGNLGVYLHVSRGADVKRFHAFPENIQPTVFAFAFEIPAAPVADKTLTKQFKVNSALDKRWKHCDIKSTSLLGNVMHFQHSQDSGVNETILFNAQNELTEASACNVFVVKGTHIVTPPLDKQLLPGITRFMVLDILRQEPSLSIEERVVTMAEVQNADEIWLTSSSKEIVPVIELDGESVGDGKVGDIWQLAQTLYSKNKFSY